MEKNSPLELRWDREAQKAAGDNDADTLRAMYAQADKERREFAGAMATMAGLYSDGKGNELLTAIRAIETISVRALSIAEAAIKAAFQQPDNADAERAKP